MKVTRKKAREVFIPVNIELETEEELENMRNVLEPGVAITLKDYCKKQSLNYRDLDVFNETLWNKLTNTKGDC